jgi:hypothetical protein
MTDLVEVIVAAQSMPLSDAWSVHVECELAVRRFIARKRQRHLSGLQKGRSAV